MNSELIIIDQMSLRERIANRLWRFWYRTKRNMGRPFRRWDYGCRKRNAMPRLIRVTLKCW